MFIKKLTRQVIYTYDTPVVETKAGKLRGTITEGTYIFRGITYAAAKRFHMPEPAAPWEGIRDACNYGYVCPVLRRSGVSQQFGSRPQYYPESEDCLSLNVWTQSIDPEAKRPVLIWIHGGGFRAGSSVDYGCDGEEMSKFGDVVVVSLNHRLNVLGYLDLSAYGEEYRHSGNLGQADIVEALKWVRDNIAAFGGDPDNVTVFGQSGGGSKITTLMQMPAADGLFHKAIMMSGVFYRDFEPPADKRATRRMAEMILRNTGISGENVKALETIPFEELAEAANKAVTQLAQESGERIDWEPLPDGEYYVGYPFDVGFRPETAHIPLMIGSVICEYPKQIEDARAAGSRHGWSGELKLELIRSRFGDEAEQLLRAFRAAYPGRDIADLLFVDGFVRAGSVRYARERAEQCDGKVFNYLYCLEMPFNGGTLPGHSTDIGYAFHNAQYLENLYIPGVSERMQDVICGAFINFARTGDPNGENIPDWEAVTPENGATMLFDAESKCLCGHDRELIELLPHKDI